ncbi:uncharacterized protein LOC136076824 [Hydra vulgaris]|uniref:Uncharacterized protein LOC136076824 n=1 Tax=Hydra vulgaris TaxID=6087 RepID=A0ABM4BBW9_HYDVU
MIYDTENEEKINFSRPRSMSNRDNQSLKKFGKPPVIKYISKQLLKKNKSTDSEKITRKRSSTTSSLLQFFNIDFFQSKEKFSPSSSPSNGSPNVSPYPRRKSFNFFRSKKSIDEYITTNRLEDSRSTAIVNRSLSLGNVLEGLPKSIKIEKLKSNGLKRKWNSLPCLQTRRFYAVTASPLVFGACSERPRVNDLKVERKQSIKVLLKQRQNSYGSSKIINRRRSSGGTEDIYIPGKILKFDNERLEQLVSITLEKSTVHMSFDNELCGIRCRRISKNLEEAVKSSLQNDENVYKVVAQVFMGELIGYGICFATQCTYQFFEDYFATSTFQTVDMFVCAIVVVEKV